MAVHKRRKGIAIVETKKGILLVAGRDKIFIFPGGGAEWWESRKIATIRELKEETGLKTKSIKYLFNYIGFPWHAHSGKLIQNHAKVFLVEAEGMPKAQHEIKYIAYWKPESKIKLASGAKVVLERYLKEFRGR